MCDYTVRIDYETGSATFLFKRCAKDQSETALWIETSFPDGVQLDDDKAELAIEGVMKALRSQIEPRQHKGPSE